MNLRRVLLLLVPAVLVLGAGAGVLVWRTRPGTAPAVTTAAVDRRTATQRAEDTFLGATAAHLCNVQSTVYDSAAALAAAYRAAPSYSGLSAAQVSQFQRRLTTDAAFAGRLTSQLQATCHRTR